MMYNTRRSQSESESLKLKQNTCNLTNSNRRATTPGNTNRESIYYSANISEMPVINRTISTPGCM